MPCAATNTVASAGAADDAGAALDAGAAAEEAGAADDVGAALEAGALPEEQATRDATIITVNSNANIFFTFYYTLSPNSLIFLPFSADSTILNGILNIILSFKHSIIKMIILYFWVNLIQFYYVYPLFPRLFLGGNRSLGPSIQLNEFKSASRAHKQIWQKGTCLRYICNYQRRYIQHYHIWHDCP